MESVLRQELATRSFQSLLAGGRAELERAVESRLVERLNELPPAGLGIQLQGLTIHDLHPPQSVVAEYHAVAEAIQKRDKLLNEASAESSRIRTRSLEMSLRTIRTAEAEAHQKVADAQASRDAILEWHTMRNTLSEAEEATLRSLPAETAQRQRESILAERKRLTEFRLALDAIVNVLRSRDKILIDADKVPGTRKLYLIDPNILPMVSPLRAEPKPQ
jgi:Cu+-exporting ATPase